MSLAFEVAVPFRLAGTTYAAGDRVPVRPRTRWMRRLMRMERLHLGRFVGETLRDETQQERAPASAPVAATPPKRSTKRVASPQQWMASRKPSPLVRVGPPPEARKED